MDSMGFNPSQGLGAFVTGGRAGDKAALKKVSIPLRD